MHDVVVGGSKILTDGGTTEITNEIVPMGKFDETDMGIRDVAYRALVRDYSISIAFKNRSSRIIIDKLINTNNNVNFDATSLNFNIRNILNNQNVFNILSTEYLKKIISEKRGIYPELIQMYLNSMDSSKSIINETGNTIFSFETVINSFELLMAETKAKYSPNTDRNFLNRFYGVLNNYNNIQNDINGVNNELVMNKEDNSNINFIQSLIVNKDIDAIAASIFDVSGIYRNSLNYIKSLSYSVNQNKLVDDLPYPLYLLRLESIVSKIDGNNSKYLPLENEEVNLINFKSSNNGNGNMMAVKNHYLSSELAAMSGNLADILLNLQEKLFQAKDRISSIINILSNSDRSADTCLEIESVLKDVIEDRFFFSKNEAESIYRNYNDNGKIIGDLTPFNNNSGRLLTEINNQNRNINVPNVIAQLFGGNPNILPQTLYSEYEEAIRDVILLIENPREKIAISKSRNILKFTMSMMAHCRLFFKNKYDILKAFIISIKLLGEVFPATSIYNVNVGNYLPDLNKVRSNTSITPYDSKTLNFTFDIYNINNNNVVITYTIFSLFMEYCKSLQIGSYYNYDLNETIKSLYRYGSNVSQKGFIIPGDDFIGASPFIYYSLSVMNNKFQNIYEIPWSVRDLVRPNIHPDNQNSTRDMEIEKALNDMLVNLPDYQTFITSSGYVKRANSTSFNPDLYEITSGDVRNFIANYYDNGNFDKTLISNYGLMTTYIANILNGYYLGA